MLSAVSKPVHRILVISVLIFAGRIAVCDDAIPNEPALRWWKGNLHTHSLWSDGDDFPEMIAEWYRTHDYNFLTLSDHNILSIGQRWMKQSDIVRRGGKDALAKYQKRFGGGWVQTRGESDDQLEIRLKPLDEFRYLVEQRGQFIMIPSEEISDRAAGKPVHMNATNIGEVIKPAGGQTVREAMQNNLRAVDEQAKRLGREIMLHLNHPNFGWAITAEDLAAVTSEKFYEVYNGHPGVNQLGDENRPSVEHIWDLANAIRLSVPNTQPLLGIATDDSHDYHGQPGSHTGRGWVEVRSRYLTPEHLIQAMRRGDFYASSGVTLSNVDFDAQSKTLSVQVAPQAGEQYSIAFIGSVKKDADETTISKENVGIVLDEVTGNQGSYRLQGHELYVRAVVTSNESVTDPSFPEQKKQAWTQPVGWKSVEAQR